MNAQAMPTVFQHSSAVRLGGRAVLFTGNSGAGKTTVMRLLQAAGWHAFGDELAVCTREPDGSWLLAAMGSTRDGRLERVPDHVPAPVGLIVHLGRHLATGYVVHPCSALLSAALGYQSIVQTGQHDPAVRASRFRTFGAFARRVPSVILDFSMNVEFAPALERCVAGGMGHGD